MEFHQNKIVGEGLTYDDVLLVPAYSQVLPREVNITSRFTKNISINVPVVSAAMDTVTESQMAIAMAREGGIGVLHKNMTIEQQAVKVRKVKRAESGMIMAEALMVATLSRLLLLRLTVGYVIRLNNCCVSLLYTLSLCDCRVLLAWRCRICIALLSGF